MSDTKPMPELAEQLAMDSSRNFSPTGEQAAAISSFSQGHTLTLNACAGSGKTATLEAMAQSDARRGLYIVFSKASADEARQRFPRHVEVLTSHSLALRQVRNRGYSDEKLFNVLNGNAIVRVLGLKSIDLSGYALMDFEVGHAVRGTISKYCQSDSADVLVDHVPENGILETLSENQLKPYRRYVKEQAEALWLLMCNQGNNGVPLGHDGYFKLWSLSVPQLPYEFVLLDEAQDSNPALVHVLRNQKNCQRVFVGDRYQQIYEWRGAVNAMDKLASQQRSLTRSFRYGQHIADFATRLLEPLGNKERLSGRLDIKGGFSSDSPDAYISRKNNTLVATLVHLESRINDVYVIGEGREILRMLDDVQRLQSNRKAAFGEFFGFKNWNAVLQFCEKVGTNSLTTTVRLVETFGEPYLRKLVSATCKDAKKARITLSTAHKAKGLEFDEVCLSDDFPDPVELDEFIKVYGKDLLPQAAIIPYAGRQLYLLKSELQVLYVATTRARRNVTLPLWCYDVYRDLVGRAPAAGVSTIAEHPASHASSATPDSPDVFAVLDFETTGLNPNKGDRAIEIGISLIRNGTEIDTFSSLINPGTRIDPFITSLTGISNRMLTSAPTAQEVIPKALKFVGDAHLVAHNASFDRKFWRNELQRTLGRDDERDFLCTLMLSRRIFQSFTSHKLGEIAQELAIEAKDSHRALSDAQVTAQVLSVMLERLQIAHPAEAVNWNFLHRYQRKTKASLPDLTTQQQSLKAGRRPAVPAKQPKVRKRKASIATSVNADIAASMHTEALRALQELEHLLEMTLAVDDRLDWDSLVFSEVFQPTVRPTSFIHYEEDGMPVDIEYLSMPDAKPEEPVLPARPVASDFEPEIGVLDKLAFREQRLLKDGQEAYSEALQQWESERQRQTANFIRQSNQWMDAAKAIDAENAKRYQQCIDDQQTWKKQKQQFDEKCHDSKLSIDRFRQAYRQHEPRDVERYVTEVLSRSNYPDYFPDEVAVIYDSSSESIEVWMRMIHPDDLPTTSSVSYVKSRDEVKSKPLSARARNALYGNVVRAVSVRTLHEVLESDTVNAVQNIVVNGYVDTIDLSSGHDQAVVIASIATTKQQFLELRLDRVDAPSCFEGLGGRGTSRSLPKLRAVSPFSIGDYAYAMVWESEGSMVISGE